MPKTLDTEVVIIGGGAAGAYAAFKLNHRKIKVLMLVKGIVGRSGCTIFASHLSVPLPKESVDMSKVRLRTEDKALEMWIKMNYFLGDQDFLKDYIQFNKKWIAEMEELGLYVRRMDDGTLITTYPESSSTFAPDLGRSGRSVGDLLRRWILHKGVDTMEEVMVTSILTNGAGRAVGVTALNYRTGEFFTVRAKAIIVATGLADYLAIRSTGTREQCANGRIMAYRAGAELYDIEMQLWHVSDIAWPRAWMRLHNYPNPLPATPETTRLVNSEGKMFFEQKSMFPLINGPYHLQLKALIREVKQGKARFDGGYYTSYKHIDQGVLREYNYQTQFLEKLGIDTSKQNVECGVTWHQNYGGVLSDVTTMETTTKGLYVAGGVTGRGSVNNACFTALLASQAIAETIPTLELETLDQEQIEKEHQRVEGFVRTGGDGPTPAQVKRMVRQVMWEKLGPIKREDTMRDGRAGLQRIRNEVIPKMRLTTDTKVWNYDLVDALDVIDMLDYCELQFHCSLLRKESRGPFYRDDYPYIDNENWLKRTIVRLRNGRMELFTRDVDQKYVKPEIKKIDYFGADY